MDSFDPDKINFFARTDARGQNVPFGIKAKDRQRHMYIIGKTGMGKSTLLENMAVQDIQNGEGVAFIDPHGSAAETLLSYVPEHRVNDVLYFAPFDMEHPVSFNIMEDVGPEKRHLVVSGLMSVFEKIWVDAWSARMAYILQNTLMALLEYPDSTLLGVNRMLSDKNYRKLVVDNVKDPGVRSFWVDEFAKYNERYMQEAGDAIKNKIGQFTANPVIRNIIGQPKSSFDIRQIMDEKKIIIMNLSKGLIGETNANLLGSMLTTRIYLAAMSRADLSPEKMQQTPNFYFYVDEFQSFANATFSNILSEARKYHLNLTIAHQYIEQMEEEVRDAVFGNVGTIISFRVGPFDAEVLETIFTPQFLAPDMVNLGFAQIYLTLMIDGIGSQPFSAITLPPIEPPTVSCKDMVIAASRKQFAHNRAEIEQAILKFHEPVVFPPKIQHENTESREPDVQERKVPERRVEQRVESPERRRNNHEVQKRTPDRVPYVRKEEPKKASEPEPITAVTNEVPSESFQKRATETYAHSHAQKTKKTQKDNLEDLRSVLKRIVTTEEIKKDTQKPDGRVDTEKKFESSRGALKDALKSALIPEQKTSEIITTEPEVSETISEIPKQNSASREPEVQSSSLKEPPVTPKELERMMRITTSDKSPF